MQMYVNYFDRLLHTYRDTTLLVLRNRKLGGMALRPTAPGFGQAQTTGDLTRYFEFFASAVGDGMSDIARDLEGRKRPSHGVLG
jgi:hypothetical protein